MWIFGFWYLRFELFWSVAFFGWICCEIARNRFDSHLLWILKHFFDFLKRFCVRVWAFGSNSLSLLQVHIVLDSVVVFIEMRWSLSVTCVCDWRFEPFLLILGSESLLVSWYCFFSSSLIRILRTSSPFLLLLFWFESCDRTCSALPPVACSCSNCRC